MKATAGSRRGFSLVEVLTVISIIAILAAIIFPVLTTLRRNMTKSSCTTNLHSIAQAIKMYKDDHGIYPDALYGYVLETNPPVPRTFLFPQYIRDRAGFRCPLAPEKSIDTDIDKLVVGVNGVTGLPMGRRYYLWDSYDGTRVPHNVANSPYRVHYLRQWDTRQLGGADVSLRQLIYRYPPDTTVVTWCTYHRDLQSDGSPAPGSADLVLFLDGRAKTVPSNLMISDALAHAVTPGI